MGLNLYEKWFTVVRIVAVVLVTGLIYLLSQLQLISFDPAPILYVIAPAYLLGTIFWFALRYFKPIGLAQIYLEFIGDLIAISAGVHFSGGTREPFVFVFLAVAITSTTISIPVTVTIGLFTGISYCALFYVEHFPILPMLQLYSGSLQNNEIIDGSVLLLMLIIIDFQASYYISRIKKEDEKMLAQEQALRKFKDDFLFKTVHDLRAPGTAIRLAIEELSSDQMYMSSSSAGQTISIIQNLDQRILKLVNDILKIGKSENVELELKKEKVNLHLILQDITKNLNPIANAKRVTIQHIDQENLPEVIADNDKIVEVLSNLIDNAIKYNKEGGVITIKHVITDKMAGLSISDQGVGIPPEDIGKLFAPYFRSETGKSIQGTGLGLYIVKNLVEKMGGQISIDSKVGEGSTFTVIFQRA